MPLPQRFLSQRLLPAIATVSIHRLSALTRWRGTVSIGATWLPILGLGLGLGLIDAGVIGQVAVAYPRTMEVTVDRQANEPYTALVQRAELAARAAAQQSFDQDILVSEVAITVLGASGESVVPILLLNVDRTDWRRLPDPQHWATYYNHAKELLE